MTDRRPVAGAHDAPTSDYAELAELVEREGLMSGRARTRAVGLAVPFATALLIGVLVVVGSTWWQLIVAATFGVAWAQASFLAHDRMHDRASGSRRRRPVSALLLADGLAGISLAWSCERHVRHHAHPRRFGVDPDVPDARLASSRASGGGSGRGSLAVVAALLLGSPALHLASVRRVLGRRPLPGRGAEVVLLAIRLAGLPLLLVLVLGPRLAFAFLVVQALVAGPLLVSPGLLAHRGIPTLAGPVVYDRLRRQVLTTRDVACGPVLAAVLGGAPFAVEHHLFPSMPRENLRRAAPVVAGWCRERGIPHTTVSLAVALALVVDTPRETRRRAHRRRGAVEHQAA